MKDFGLYVVGVGFAFVGGLLVATGTMESRIAGLIFGVTATGFLMGYVRLSVRDILARRDARPAAPMRLASGMKHDVAEPRHPVRPPWPGSR